MSLETWGLFVLVSILPVMSPGPAILLAVSNSIRFGVRATVFSGLGNAIGVAMLGFAVAIGLAAIISASAIAFTIIKAVGAIYLLYLGVKLWRNKTAFNMLSQPVAMAKTRRQFFLEAFALALTNPKGLLLVAAIIPPFINHSQPALPQAFILAITFASLCYLNHIGLACIATRTRRFLATQRRLDAVRRVIGSLFIGFAAALALSTRS